MTMISSVISSCRPGRPQGEPGPADRLCQSGLRRAPAAGARIRAGPC